MQVNRQSPVTAASVPIVTVEEAKLFLRIDQDEEDQLLYDIIAAATEWCQVALQQQFLTATYKGYLDSFPSTDYIEVALPPLQSVTHLKYYDSAGNQQTWSTDYYSVDADQMPGHIQLGYSYTWPVTYGIPKAIEVQFVCGYGDAASSVPGNIVAAVKRLIHDLHQSRSGVFNPGVASQPIPNEVYRMLLASSHGVI